jgi:hypothetical protein
VNLASQAQPIYPNAYVTFGAGMRQKEIDTYTANHQLEARSLAGPNTTIPYHVPLYVCLYHLSNASDVSPPSAPPTLWGLVSCF